VHAGHRHLEPVRPGGAAVVTTSGPGRLPVGGASVVETAVPIAEATADVGPGRATAVGRRPAGRAGWLGARVGLAAALVLISFPDLGRPYEGGLDPSWVIGLDALRHGGRAWGRDVAFTYGPLGFAAVPLNAGTAPTLAGWLLLLGFYLPWWIATAVLAGRIEG